MLRLRVMEKARVVRRQREYSHCRRTTFPKPSLQRRVDVDFSAVYDVSKCMASEKVMPCIFTKKSMVFPAEPSSVQTQ